MWHQQHMMPSLWWRKYIKSSMRSKRIMLLLIAVVLDGDGEYRKAWRLIAGDVDCKHLILIWCNAYLFNLPFGDLFHRTKSKGSCYEIFTIICNGINLFNNHHAIEVGAKSK